MNVHDGPGRHHRRSIRLHGYDYSQAGAYAVTACTHGQASLFGRIANGEMRLNAAGRLAESVWDGLPGHYPHVALDAFVVMPNHVHGIIILADADQPPPVGAGFKPAPTMRTRHGLPEIVRAFKTFSARHINECRRTPGLRVWQRNYFEHVIRNDDALNRIRQYIVDNPAKWSEDRENPCCQPRAMHNPR